MISKTLMISLDGIRPNTVNESFIVKELLEHTVMHSIRTVTVSGNYYKGLNVMFNYKDCRDIYEGIFEHNYGFIDLNELSKINRAITEFIAKNLDEFNISGINCKENIANISMFLMNKNTCLVSVDFFES